MMVAWSVQTERVGATRDGAERRARVLAGLAASSARRGFAIAYDLLGDRAEAEDAVQEALARACGSLGSLRDEAALPGWFFRVLTNACLRVLRRRRVWRVVRGLWPFGGEDDTAEPAADAAPADDVLARGAEAAWLGGALARLPARQRAALVLRYGHDLSVGEVADMLGVGEGTVKTHLTRGLARLRELAAREEPT